MEAYIGCYLTVDTKEIFHGALLQIFLLKCLGEIIDRTSLVAPSTASELSFGIKDCLLSFLMQALVSFVLKHSIEAGLPHKQTVTEWATCLLSLNILMALQLRW